MSDSLLLSGKKIGGRNGNGAAEISEWMGGNQATTTPSSSCSIAAAVSSVRSKTLKANLFDIGWPDHHHHGLPFHAYQIGTGFA